MVPGWWFPESCFAKLVKALEQLGGKPRKGPVLACAQAATERPGPNMPQPSIGPNAGYGGYPALGRVRQ